MKVKIRTKEELAELKKKREEALEKRKELLKLNVESKSDAPEAN